MGLFYHAVPYMYAMIIVMNRLRCVDFIEKKNRSVYGTSLAGLSRGYLNTCQAAVPKI